MSLGEGTVSSHTAVPGHEAAVDSSNHIVMFVFVQVIVEKAEKSDIPDIDKKK